MIGLAFPVAFSPCATSSFSFTLREMLFSFEPLTPSSNGILTPSYKVSCQALAGQGSNGIEINKWVSSSRFRPSSLLQSLPLRCPQGDKVLRGGSRLSVRDLGYQPLGSCSFEPQFPHLQSRDKVYFTVHDCEDLKDPT